jgi:hypothetical protein
MSDKPLPITLTGLYKGYQVSVQVEATLDSLDKLVARLQDRGVEPLPTAPAPSKGSGSSKQRATVKGVVREIRPSKETVFAIDLDTGDGGAPLRCVAFGSMAHIAGNRLFVRTECELSGEYREHETYGTSFVISGIVSTEKQAA